VVASSLSGPTAHFTDAGGIYACPTVVTDPLTCPGDTRSEGGPLPGSVLTARHFISWSDDCLTLHPTTDPQGLNPAATVLNVSPFVVITPDGNGSLVIDFNISPPRSFSNHRLEALFTIPESNVELLPGSDDFIIHIQQDAVPLVWTSGPNKNDPFGYMSMGDIVYETPTAPPPPPPGTMGVSSIEVSQVGGGQRIGRALVTVVDDEGSPVQGVTVEGTFTGDVNGTATGTTNASGTAAIDSPTTSNGNLHFTFCIDTVTDPSTILTYNPAANVESCESR
jgi:hypothetical protein